MRGTKALTAVERVERHDRMIRHVRMLTAVRALLRDRLPAKPAPAVAPCRLHGLPWTECTACSKARR